jgi:hypothetical protein
VGAENAIADTCKSLPSERAALRCAARRFVGRLCALELQQDVLEEVKGDLLCLGDLLTLEGLRAGSRVLESGRTA